MKPISITVICGLLLALPVIYFLQLEGPGAISLVILLSIGLVTLLVSLAGAIRGRNKQGGTHS